MSAACKNNCGPDFPSFVRHGLKEESIRGWVHFLPQHFFICDATGKIMVDFVGRVENLDADFAQVADRLGCARGLTKVNAGSRRHYSNYYDDETREIVQQVYAKDIELFGYAFQAEGEI